MTKKEIKVIHEGVDDTIFHPPKSGLLRRKLLHFFGRQTEYHKGQIWYCVHLKYLPTVTKTPALLLHGALWPQLSLGMKGVFEHELKLTNDNFLDIKRWCSENGIPEWKVIDLPIMSNYSMSEVYREIDVGIQLSRAEACTCLPLMEMMASGIPCVASSNTGLMDLINEKNSIPIECEELTECQAPETIGWGCADLDATVEALETIYQNKSQRTNLGNNAASWMRQNGRTWSQHAQDLKTWLASL